MTLLINTNNYNFDRSIVNTYSAYRVQTKIVNRAQGS